MEASNLATEHLVLTPIAEPDISRIFEACQDSQIQKWTAVPNPYSLEDAERFVREFVPAAWASGSPHWAIRTSEGDPLLGTISVAVNNGIGTIGYWLAPEARGHNYAVEAVNAVLDFFFDSGLSAMRWDCFMIDGEVNWASAHVAWQCGFTFEGVRRAAYVSEKHGLLDVMTASLLREDSRAPKGPWRGPTAKHPAFADARDVEALVRQFHETYNLPIIENDPNANRERIHMRLGLVVEECCELIGASYGTRAREIMEEAFKEARTADDGTRDTVEVADALGDIAYVVYGMALELGIPMQSVLAEIQGSNLSKLGADGKPIYREDGKVLKGPNYYRPNIRAVLGL